MASSPVLLLVLLLAMILSATASVQARHVGLPPPPAEAPAPAGNASLCKPKDIAELKPCVDLRLGGTSQADKDRCCQRIREMPSTDSVACLCAAFWPSNARPRAIVANEVNAVLNVCGKPRVPDPVCLIALPSLRIG